MDDVAVSELVEASVGAGGAAVSVAGRDVGACVGSEEASVGCEDDGASVAGAVVSGGGAVVSGAVVCGAVVVSGASVVSGAFVVSGACADVDAGVCAPPVPLAVEVVHLFLSQRKR